MYARSVSYVLRIFFILHTFICCTGQEFKWARMKGSDDNDAGRAVTVDSTGNAYVVGYRNHVVGSNQKDLFLTKYSADGTAVWTSQSTITTANTAYGVVYDGTSNSVYVCSCTSGTLDEQTNAGSEDIVVIKYDLLGVKQWTKLWGATGNQCAYGITAKAGAMYITGSTSTAFDGQNIVGGLDFFLIKFDGDGNKAYTIIGGTNLEDVGTAVTVDTDDNVYIAGTVINGGIPPNVPDLFVVKYSSTSSQLWRYTIATFPPDTPYSIVTDTDLNVYVVGETYSSLFDKTNAGGYDVFVMQLLPDGTLGWNEVWHHERRFSPRNHLQQHGELPVRHRLCR